MRRLVLIRHGQTEASERRLYYGATDLPLTENGKAQLLAKKDRYPALLPLVVTSGMLRTEQTLSCIYGDVPHEIHPELREVDLGIFEMRHYDDVKALPEYQAWLAGDWYGNVPPGGESFDQAEKRIAAAFRVLLQREQDMTAVVHGGTILVVMPMLFPGERSSSYEWQPAPGGGYAVDLEAHTYETIG